MLQIPSGEGTETSHGVNLKWRIRGGVEGKEAELERSGAEQSITGDLKDLARVGGALSLGWDRRKRKASQRLWHC